MIYWIEMNTLEEIRNLKVQIREAKTDEVKEDLKAQLRKLTTQNDKRKLKLKGGLG